MRKATSIGCTLLLAAPVLGQQLSPADFSTLQGWKVNLRSHRPGARIRAAQAGAAGIEDDGYIGVTLWRLRPSMASDYKALRIRSQEDGAAIEWTPERAPIAQPLFEGDRFQIIIETTRPGYLYIIENDDYVGIRSAPHIEQPALLRTRSRLIFPTLDTPRGDNRVSAGSVIRIPSGVHDLPYFEFVPKLALRDNKTFEVIISSQPIAEFYPRHGTLTAEQIAKLQNPLQSAKPLEFFQRGAIATPQEIEVLKRGSSVLTQDDPLPEAVYHADAPRDALLTADISVHVVPVPRSFHYPECPPPHSCSFLGPAELPRIVTARAFLTPLASEETGYGLYSYVLFGSRPRSLDSDEWRRYQQTIVAFLGVPASRELLQYAPPARINTTFLPVTCDWRELSSGASEFFNFSQGHMAIHRLEHQAASKLLPDEIRETLRVENHADEIACILVGNYDYARAEVLLSHFASPHMDGPYIISAIQPLSSAMTPPNHYLYQDLSFVPPELVSSWIKEFMVQAQEPEFWKMRTKDQFILRLRTAIAVAGQQLPDFEKAIRWQFAALQHR
jgi:hypothetical protein